MASAVTENPSSARQETASKQEHTVSETDSWSVTHVAGFVVNYFVAGIDDGAKTEVHRFTDADRDQDFRFRIIGNLKILLYTDGDGFAQGESRPRLDV